MTLIDQIREMIAEGETEKSLNELYKYVKENNADIIDNLVLLRSRMQNLEHGLQVGTMDEQGAALERAKINEAILKLLPQLTPEYLAEAGHRREEIHQAILSQKTVSAAPPKNRKMIYIIGGALLLIVLLIMIINGSGGSDDLLDDEYAFVEGDLTPAEGTLLYDVVNDHAGYAIWKSDYSEVNGQSIFRMESNTVCQEIKNNQVIRTFEVVTNSADYVTLFDATRQMFVRIGDTQAQFHAESEDTWHNLFAGNWITPPDAQ